MVKSANSESCTFFFVYFGNPLIQLVKFFLSFSFFLKDLSSSRGSCHILKKNFFSILTISSCSIKPCSVWIWGCSYFHPMLVKSLGRQFIHLHLFTYPICSLCRSSPKKSKCYFPEQWFTTYPYLMIRLWQRTESIKTLLWTLHNQQLMATHIITSSRPGKHFP